MFTHLLLPTDGSKLSEIAVQRGVQFAKSVNARVTGCSVVPKLHFFNYDSDMPTAIKEQAIQECMNQQHSLQRMKSFLPQRTRLLRKSLAQEHNYYH